MACISTPRRNEFTFRAGAITTLVIFLYISRKTRTITKSLAKYPRRRVPAPRSGLQNSIAFISGRPRPTRTKRRFLYLSHSLRILFFMRELAGCTKSRQNLRRNDEEVHLDRRSCAGSTGTCFLSQLRNRGRSESRERYSSSAAGRTNSRSQRGGAN